MEFLPEDATPFGAVSAWGGRASSMQRAEHHIIPLDIGFANVVIVAKRPYVPIPRGN